MFLCNSDKKYDAGGNRKDTGRVVRDKAELLQPDAPSRQAHRSAAARSPSAYSSGFLHVGENRSGRRAPVHSRSAALSNVPPKDFPSQWPSRGMTVECIKLMKFDLYHIQPNPPAPVA